MSAPSVRIWAPPPINNVMLGVRENRTIITGIYAQKMRDALRRKYTDSPNEEDLRAKERSEKIKSEYNAIWK